MMNLKTKRKLTLFTACCFFVLTGIEYGEPLSKCEFTFYLTAIVEIICFLSYSHNISFAMAVHFDPVRISKLHARSDRFGFQLDGARTEPVHLRLGGWYG